MMRFLKKALPVKKPSRTSVFLAEGEAMERHCLENFSSPALGRPVRVDLLLPPNYHHRPESSYPLLLLNDGQDLEALSFVPTLNNLYHKGQLRGIIVAAIHAGDRMQEYGTAGRPDYLQRGAKADAYHRFVLRELLPALHRHYRITTEAAEIAVAGFSLGGLSALDLVWRHPDCFGKAGVFSGSLWWRSKAFRPSAPDADRIMHDIIRRSKYRPGLRFWFQAGTHDETEDRNNNGIIDAIDDTRDLIRQLAVLGYREGKDIKYVEVIRGEHNPRTWGKVMPDFLRWAYGPPVMSEK